MHPILEAPDARHAEANRADASRTLCPSLESFNLCDHSSPTPRTCISRTAHEPLLERQLRRSRLGTIWLDWALGGPPRASPDARRPPPVACGNFGPRLVDTRPNLAEIGQIRHSIGKILVDSGENWTIPSGVAPNLGTSVPISTKFDHVRSIFGRNRPKSARNLGDLDRRAPASNKHRPALQECARPSSWNAD